jgi:hypothetical protein
MAPKKPPILILTGLGLDYPRQATLEVLEALRGCDLVLSNLAGVEAMDFLSLFCPKVRSISFEGRKSRSWADKVFSYLKPGLKVALVTRAHPLVSGHLAYRLLKRAKSKGVQVRSYGAISSVDQMLALSQEVLGETFWGLQIYDARLLLSGKLALQDGVPAIIYLGVPDGQKKTAAFIKELSALLVRRCGGRRRVCLFGPRYEDRRLEVVRAASLRKRLERVDAGMLSSIVLLVPPSKTVVPV